MKNSYIEIGEFREWVNEYLSDDALSELQPALLSEPDCGSVMPGPNVSDPGRRDAGSPRGRRHRGDLICG
jgi:hypothetical protein